MLKVIILTTASKYIQLVLMYVNDILLDSGCCFQVNHDWNVHSISIVPNCVEDSVHSNTHKVVLFLM